ncbi:hypothetical protein [Methylorubrum extorquens]|uniref:hypothetical protein n=1 Tax=Methylorubrum extorquens TaxID=408 RepID=UPI0022379F9D|nr:hypothetical protein [Methylorubrum extorquens]UYW34296.1 hypothetical protein OKB92_09520 [Methylorubrum extorquens]
MNWRFSLFLVLLFGLLVAFSLAPWNEFLCKQPLVVDLLKQNNNDGAIGCFEFWFNRYQTFLAAIIAFCTALVAFRPAFAQLAELRKQNSQGEFNNIKFRSVEISEAKDYFFKLSSGIEIANRKAQDLIAQHPSWGLSPEKVVRFLSAKDKFDADIPGIEKTIVAIPSDIGSFVLRKNLIDIAYKFGHITGRVRTRLDEAGATATSHASLQAAVENARNDLLRIDDLNDEWRKAGQAYFDALIREELRMEAAMIDAHRRAFG